MTLVSHTRVSIDSGSVLPKTPSSLGRATQEVPVKQRFVISKMILNNFKSYFGKQEIDALLFVFGYRANKMRQAKLSELIHSSQGCENLDACSVDIYFDEILDLPGSNNYENFKYKVSLEEANEKGETLDEERAEKLNRVKIVEKEKLSLKAKNKEAKNYLRDENTLTLKQSALYQKKLLGCKINSEISTKAV
ncbi:12529_t:CDS:2, partial [Funneliformis caledonium]